LREFFPKKGGAKKKGQKKWRSVTNRRKKTKKILVLSTKKSKGSNGAGEEGCRQKKQRNRLCLEFDALQQLRKNVEKGGGVI